MQILLPQDSTLTNDCEIRTAYSNKGTSTFDYEQIDTIRFITICFIVWGHCLLGWDERVTNSWTDEIVRSLVLQTGRISTIIFFIVSGFLLRPKINEYTVKSYFKKRIPKIYLPWFLSISFLMVISVIQLLPLHDLWVSRDLNGFIKLNYNILNGLLLYSSYWFITTYMAGMAIIIYFRKYVEKFWFGAILLLFTIFYCINLHYLWIDPNHEKAILAYTFFIWLGVQVNVYSDVILKFIKQISWLTVILLFFSLFIVACFEGETLAGMHLKDAYASNRFTNILVSIVFFLALLKLGKLSAVNILNPRKTVYGIYLIHNILIFECYLIINTFFKETLSTLNFWNLFAIQIAFVIFIMVLTYKIVSVIGKSRYSWAIGGK
ncbi:MAG: hypothetical protein JWQ25_2276 [Daejeonella sp.]|nr:hypothetical protein [Daejeonella sp.]